MQVTLVMFRADGERRSFSLSQDLVVVGRREDCDLRIPLGEISRKHCQFIKDKGKLRVEDLGSSNGTFHNGRRIQKSVLQPGDTLQIGPVLFVVQIDNKPPDDALRPVISPASASTESEEYEALAPTAQSEVETTEPFDPTEVLQTRDDSEFGVVVDDADDAENSVGVDLGPDDSQSGRKKSK